MSYTFKYTIELTKQGALQSYRTIDCIASDEEAAEKELAMHLDEMLDYYDACLYFNSDDDAVNYQGPGHYNLEDGDLILSQQDIDNGIDSFIFEPTATAYSLKEEEVF